MAPLDELAPEPEPELEPEPDPEPFAEPDAFPEPPELLLDADRERDRDPEPAPDPAREPELAREPGPESSGAPLLVPLLVLLVGASAGSAAWSAGCARPRNNEPSPPVLAVSPLALSPSTGALGSAFVALGPDLGPEPFGLPPDALAVLSTTPAPATAMRGPTRFRTMYCWPIVQKFVVIQ